LSWHGGPNRGGGGNYAGQTPYYAGMPTMRYAGKKGTLCGKLCASKFNEKHEKSKKIEKNPKKKKIRKISKKILKKFQKKIEIFFEKISKIFRKIFEIF